MEYRIEYLPSFTKDFNDALDYLLDGLHSPQAAEALLDELEEVVAIIRRRPYAWPPYYSDRPMKSEIRKAFVKGYVLYYAVFEDYVQIRRFLHGLRDRRSEMIE